MSNIVMPRLSDSMTDGTIANWLKSDGEHVTEGEEIVEIETDKATMAYETEYSGVLHIVAEAGETLAVGSVIGTVSDGSPTAPTPALAGATSDGTDPASDSKATAERGTRQATEPGVRRGHGPTSSPLARRIAARLGVELASVEGSGRGGRILKRDVVRQTSAASATVATRRAVQFSSQEFRLEPTSRVQKLIAQRMVDSRSTVPEFHVDVEVNMTQAMELRRQLKTLTDAPPSVNDLIIKTAAVALMRHSRVNGSYCDDGFELHDEINIGFAVAVDNGLLVPTVRGAANKTLGEIARETRDLANRARTGLITPAELEGATFTISNLGMFGVSRFEAIINAPQAAILGAGAVVDRPVAIDGQVEVAPIMLLTLACDHRIIYGADAASFLADLRGLLEAPLTTVL